VLSVAGVPLEARRVCGQFQGTMAQSPPPPGAMTSPWWQVKKPLAPGGLRGTALGPPFHSARAQRGTTKTWRCSSPATATPRSTAMRQPRMATQVGGFGTRLATLAWCCTAVPTVPRWRNSGRHIPVKIIYFLPCYFLFIPTAFLCTRIKQTPYKNIKY
jgi:hypothetical protein